MDDGPGDSVGHGPDDDPDIRPYLVQSPDSENEVLQL